MTTVFFFFLPSSAPSCLSCAAAPCSWDLSTSEDWATCWEPTVPAAARCPTRPWRLGTALTGGCSTQSTCWHTVAQKILCWWRVMWVKTQKSYSLCTCTVSFIYYFLLCTMHVRTAHLADERRHPVSCSRKPKWGIFLLLLQASCLSLFLCLREKLVEACRTRGRVLQSRPDPAQHRTTAGLSYRETHTGETHCLSDCLSVLPRCPSPANILQWIISVSLLLLKMCFSDLPYFLKILLFNTNIFFLYFQNRLVTAYLISLYQHGKGSLLSAYQVINHNVGKLKLS